MYASHHLLDQLVCGLPKRVTCIVPPAFIHGHTTFPNVPRVGNKMILRGLHILFELAPVADKDVRLKTTNFRVDLRTTPRFRRRASVIEQIGDVAIVGHQFPKLSVRFLYESLPPGRIPGRSRRVTHQRTMGRTRRRSTVWIDGRHDELGPVARADVCVIGSGAGGA